MSEHGKACARGAPQRFVAHRLELSLPPCVPGDLLLHTQAAGGARRAGVRRARGGPGMESVARRHVSSYLILSLSSCISARRYRESLSRCSPAHMCSLLYLTGMSLSEFCFLKFMIRWDRGRCLHHVSLLNHFGHHDISNDAKPSNGRN